MALSTADPVPGDLHFTTPVGEGLKTQTGIEGKKKQKKTIVPIFTLTCWFCDIPYSWNTVLVISYLSQSKISMACINSKAFCLNVPQINFKEQNTSATWEEAPPTEEQMHFPFAVLAPALTLMETLEREPSKWGEQAGTSPRQPSQCPEMSAATNKVLRARCGFGWGVICTAMFSMLNGLNSTVVW